MKLYRSFLRDHYNLRHRGIEIGSDADTGKDIFLDLKLFPKGVHVLGPPGSGKSRMLLQLFTLFCRLPNTAIVLLNPKGSLAKQAQAAAIAAGQTDRLVIFDPNDHEFLPGYNPLKPNSLDVGIHAKMVREGIRASWGQSSFDQTPQLARFLFLGLYIAREQEMTIVEAVQILRPHSPLRESILPLIRDPYIRETLIYLDSLRPERQEDLVASCLARLEAFSLDPLLRSILIQRERALNIAEIISQNKILVVDVPFYNPIRPDDAVLLLRLILNDVLASTFGRENKKNRICIIADEFHTYANEDFCTAVELGRELNLCAALAHQHMGQLIAQDGTTRLLDAVKNCCKTRVVFGGNWKKDLEELTEDMMIDQYDPWAIKDEITSLELNPIETTRTSISKGDAVSEGKSRSYGETDSQSRGNARQRSMTTSRGGSETRGMSESDTEGESEDESETDTNGGSLEKGSSSSEGDGEAVTQSWVRTHTEGVAISHGTNRSRTTARGTTHGHATSVSDGDGLGASSVLSSGYSTDSEGNATFSTSSAFGSNSNSSSSRTETDSSSDSDSESETEGESDSVTFSEANSTAKGRAFTKSRNRSNAKSENEGVNWSKAKGRNTARNRAKTHGQNQSVGANWSESKGEGESESEEYGSAKNWTEGENESRTKNQSATTAPFYEYIKRRPVTSRTFLTEQEQMTEFLKKIKEQRVGHFVLKVQGNKARFMKAPFVPNPVIPKTRLEAARQKIFSRPYYTRKIAIQAELPCPVLAEPDLLTTMEVKHGKYGTNPSLDIVEFAKSLRRKKD